MKTKIQKQMAKNTLLRLSFSVLVCFQSTSVFSQASVWVTHSTEKILPNAPSRSLASATIKAARNEFESFQVVVMGSRTNVSATASVLTGPGSAQVPAPHLFREGLITCTNKSSNDGATGTFPDALIPDVDDVVGEKRNAFPFNVPSGQNRVIWVEYHVPDNATAGTYQGNVVISSSEGNVTVPVTLTVWNFTLPSTSSLRSYFALSYGSLPNEHGVSGNAFSTLLAKYSQMGLDHRISISGFDDGNSDINHIAQYYGPHMDGTAPTQLKGAKLTTLCCKYRNVTTMQSWINYAKPKGWFDRMFDYTADEPGGGQFSNWSQVPGRVKTARDADPNLRTLVTATIDEAQTNNATSLIDILVPVVNYMYNKPGQTYAGLQRPKYDSWLATNSRRQLWMYQSCMSHGCGGSSDGWASYIIDHTAIRSRAMEWLSFQYDVSGELYYSTTEAYGNNPWNNQWLYTGNGDGTLFYPGKTSVIGGQTDIPVASIRLKMIREGYEDYEYLKMLADCGEENYAKQVAASLFPNPWTQPTPSDLFSAREQLANKIIACSTSPTPNILCTLSQSPVIDGVAENTWTSIQKDTLKNTQMLAGTISSSADLFSTYKATWDNIGLYLLVNVKDDTLKNDSGGATWDDDAIEVFLDGNNDKATTYDANDHQYIFRVNDATVYEYKSGAAQPVNPTGVTFAQGSYTGGYLMEIKIAWSALGVTAANAKLIGLDIHVDDDDDGGSADAKEMWSSKAGQTTATNPSFFGTIKLENTPCDVATGLIKSKEGKKMMLLPNPAREFVILQFNDPLPGITGIEIVNIMGQKIYAEDLPGGTLSKQISLGSLPAGIYFIKTESGDQRQIQKFIKG